jgi:hypothetical protein
MPAAPLTPAAQSEAEAQRAKMRASLGRQDLAFEVFEQRSSPTPRAPGMSLGTIEMSVYKIDLSVYVQELLIDKVQDGQMLNIAAGESVGYHFNWNSSGRQAIVMYHAPADEWRVWVRLSKSHKLKLMDKKMKA